MQEEVSVLHVISTAGPHPYFRTLIEAGGLDRGSLCVGCVGPEGALQQDMAALGVATFALGARGRAQHPPAVARLVGILRRHRPDIVQTHLPDGCVVGLTAARLARTPVAVMTAHHSHELPFHGRRLVWPERYCAMLADHIIAPSRQVADTLVRLARVPEAKIEVVHHGFDMSRLNPDAVDRDAVRRALGVQDRLVFGAVGRIYALKNYSALLEAFAAVLADVPEACMMIVGPGDQSDLRALASRLQISDRVILLGPRSDIPELMACFDVFVHPAIAESFGMVIVEAMAMARPVLSTPVGIAPEIIDGSVGYVASGADVQELASGLLKILATRSQWGVLGAAARARVASSFSATRMARQYVELYEMWLRERRRRV